MPKFLEDIQYYDTSGKLVTPITAPTNLDSHFNHHLIVPYATSSSPPSPVWEEKYYLYVAKITSNECFIHTLLPLSGDRDTDLYNSSAIYYAFNYSLYYPLPATGYIKTSGLLTIDKIIYTFGVDHGNNAFSIDYIDTTTNRKETYTLNIDTDMTINLKKLYV